MSSGMMCGGSPRHLDHARERHQRNARNRLHDVEHVPAKVGAPGIAVANPSRHRQMAAATRPPMHLRRAEASLDLTSSMGLQGFLDKCGSDSIAGWAWNPENPHKRVSVDIFDGSRFLKRVRANCFRKDLEIGGKGQGVCAFNYVLPSFVLDDRLHQVHVQFADTAEELTRSPQFVVWSVSERRELEQTLRAFLKKPRWYIMSARFTRGRLEITGWALPPFDGRATTLRVNGASFDEVQMRFPSPECGNIFWYWPNSDRCRFVCRAAVQQADLFRNGRAKLEYADALTGEAHYSFHDFYWPLSLFTVGNIHADRDIVRAAGLPHRHLFLQGGYTTFVKLKQRIKRKLGFCPKH